MMDVSYSNTVLTNTSEPERVKSLDDVLIRHKRVAKIFSDFATGNGGGCAAGFPVVNWDDWRCFLRVSLRNCDGITKSSNNHDSVTSDEDSETDSDATNNMFDA